MLDSDTLNPHQHTMDPGYPAGDVRTSSALAALTTYMAR